MSPCNQTSLPARRRLPDERSPRRRGRRSAASWASRLVAFATCCVVAWATAAAASLVTLPLQHRPAEELIPLLQPLLPAGAALTGTGDVLLLRADAATEAEVRRALAALDRAPRQLLISVGQSMGTSRQSGGVRATGTIGSGDVRVGVDRPPAGAPGLDVAVGHSSTREDIRTLSSVRALEGREVFVATGESRPFTSTTVVGGGWHGPVTVGTTTGFQDTRTGFNATPRVAGDRVTLEIAPMQQRFTGDSRDAASVATQSAQTTVSGRLGEWIEIGGVSDARDGSTTGVATWQTRSGLTRSSAWVKVEQVE